MMTRWLIVMLIGSWGGGHWAVGQDKMEGVACPVMAQATAKSTKSADYRGGKVYFCCDKCLNAFQTEPEKYAVNANRQLVQTGQFEQVACPITGNPVNSAQTEEVGGVPVSFCCGGCKGRVANAADDAAKAGMIFTSAAFEKGYAAKQDPIKVEGVKCMFMVRKDVNPEKFAEFEGGKVFFCCDNCLKRFNTDPKAHATKAHHQLVRTGQVKQTACPISGHEVDKDVVTEVGGVKVAFCCADCQGKVTGAESDDARVEMIFGADGYKRGFSKKDE